MFSPDDVMPIDTILSKARRAKWLMHRDDMQYLVELARKAPSGASVELGVYLGSSLIAIALARAGQGDCIGVDNWIYKDIEGLEEKCRANLNFAGLGPASVDLWSSTSESASHALDQELAFCFIDADHTKVGIEKDLELWPPKLKRDGILVLHDYGRHKNECYVTEAVDAWFLFNQTNWELLGVVGTTIAFKRRPNAATA